MSDIYINLVIIGIIIALFLAYVLISQFFSNYTDYRDKVNDDLKKTTRYINSTTKTLDNNIKTTTTNMDKLDIDLRSKIKSINNDLTTNMSDLTSARSNITTLSTNMSIDTANLSNLDKNLKRFVDFKDNNVSINDALYNYRFSSVPNLSVSLIKNVSAISGMTVNTDNTNLMRICDNNLNNSNCIDMNIINGSFDIYPSPTANNNINNINIYNKNKRSIAKFDLTSSNIYLGSDNENAGMFINGSNVYLKNVNFLANNTNYGDNKVAYNDANGPSQTFNTYNYGMNDIMKLKQISISINGIYTIFNPNTIVINFKPTFNVPVGKVISIDVPELVSVSSSVPINNSDSSSSSLISTGVINQKKIILTTATAITANTNVRVKLVDETVANAETGTVNKIVLETAYRNENYVSNIFTTIPL